MPNNHVIIHIRNISATKHLNTFRMDHITEKASPDLFYFIIFLMAYFSDPEYAADTAISIYICTDICLRRRKFKYTYIRF